MKYTYRISDINERERWISIVSDDRFDCQDPDAFIQLLKRIIEHVNGKVEEIEELQYKIHGDGHGLIYQWDSCFGITVIYPDNASKEEVVKFLEKFTLRNVNLYKQNNNRELGR